MSSRDESEPADGRNPFRQPRGDEPGRHELDGSGATQDVPAGGAGADSGATEAVRVDPDDTAEIPDRSVHNDEAGVGTRDADEPEE